MKLRENGKVFIFLYMLGFFVGVLYANTVAKDYIALIGIFNEYFFNQYVQTDIVETEYLWYLIRLRITPVVILLGLGYFQIRKAAVIIFLLWTGFLSGLLVASAIIKMGILGSVFCLVAVFPQMIFYVVAFSVLLWNIYEYPKARWNLSKILILLLIVMVGILAECYINPALLKMFLKTV